MEKGVTFVEIAVVGAIMAIIGGMILTLQYSIGQNQLNIWKNYVDVNQINSSVANMTREIRTARSSDNGSYLLNSLDDNQIIFYSDLDYDDQAERVRYTLSENSLEKGVIEPVGFPATYPEAEEKVIVLSENIKNNETPVFSYYNGDWPYDTINNPLDIGSRLLGTQIVKIFLVINSSDNPDRNFTLESYAQIRMIKNNL